MAEIDHKCENHAQGVRMKDLPIVYVLASADLNYIKIGKTVNLKQRMHNIQNGCPFMLHAWMGIRTSAPADIEKYLHEKLREHRLRGEWFSLPAEKQDWLIAYCADQNRKTRESL